jgi:hypothetical protein
MSDYLRRAVEREMSEIPAVRPALPSLFESGKTTALAAGLEPESPVKGGLSRNARSETKAENSPSPPASLAAASELWADAAATPELRPRPAEATPGSAPAEIVGTPVAASMAAVAEAESPSLAPPDQPAGVGVRRTTEAPAEPPLAPALEMDASIPRIARATTKGTKAKLEPPPAVVPVAAPGAPAVIPASVVAPPAHAVTPAASPIPPVVPAPSRFERAANARAPRPDPSAPRAIHITIGRIEVHAIHPPPPAPPQRRAPASPKISLEDYLKQRSGGRR